MSIQQPLRVVVWSTGGVGKVAIDAVSRRPDLDSLGYGYIRRTRSAGTRGSWPAATRSGWRPPTTPRP